MCNNVGNSQQLQKITQEEDVIALDKTGWKAGRI